MNKRFWHYNFPFSRCLRVWKMKIEWQFCTRDKVKGVNLLWDSQFFKRDESVKMEIHSGKTLSPANLSNLEACFPEFSILRKIKKKFCYIHLTNLLDSRFFQYKFPFSRSHLVWKIENLVTDLPPRLRLGCKIVTRFSFSKIENGKIVSKLFVHTKFDKFI